MSTHPSPPGDRRASLERVVLVVEDSLAQRQQITDFLRDKGIAVVEASNGREAIRSIADERPAVVIMDVSMPELDGIEVARRCRDIDPMPKIILMSGFHDMVRKANEERLNVFAVVDKPVSLAVLGKFVESALRRI